MPKFTIGIPTFNRAKWVGNAIECALSQTYRDVEVIVSDNASTDDTEKVVRQYGNRLRYIRNDENIGAWRNLRQLVDLAQGQYFSWLQDDDCVFNQFAERAAACLGAFPRAIIYGAYAAVNGNVSNLANSWLYGPPLPLNWRNGQPRAIRGDLIAPLSLCVSVAIPPVVAFRTVNLKESIVRCNEAIPLFMERTILADIALKGEAVFEPYVAGVFRIHANQYYRVMQTEDSGAHQQQWLQMAQQLDAIVKNQNGEWRRSLVEIISEISEGYRQNWEVESRSWPSEIAICREMRGALLSKPESKRIPLSPSGLFKAGKRFAKSILPRVGK